MEKNTSNVTNKLQGSGLTASLLLNNIGQLDSLYREYEDPLKSPPTYYYLEHSISF